jgi:hypothetical protein
MEEQPRGIAEPLRTVFDWQCLQSSEIDLIARAMKTGGCAVLDNLVSDDEIRHAAELAHRLVADNGDESVLRGGQEGYTGYLLSELHGELSPLLGELFQEILGRPAASTRIRQSSRFLAGASHDKLSGYYHFDSYVIALIVPILLPEPGLGGEFVMAPNARPLHQPYIVGAVQKAIYDTRFMQKRLARQVHHGRTAQVPMRAGQGYLFIGHTSLHSNERCIGKQRRFTVIFHFGDPHEGSKVRQLGTLLSRRYHAMMNALKI